MSSQPDSSLIVEPSECLTRKDDSSSCRMSSSTHHTQPTTTHKRTNLTNYYPLIKQERWCNPGTSSPKRVIVDVDSIELGYLILVMKEAGNVPLGVQRLLSLLKSISSSRRISIPMTVIVTGYTIPLMPTQPQADIAYLHFDSAVMEDGEDMCGSSGAAITPSGSLVTIDPQLATKTTQMSRHPSEIETNHRKHLPSHISNLHFRRHVFALAAACLSLSPSCSSSPVIDNTMPRLPSSRSGRRRHPRPQLHHPRRLWALRRAYVLVSRRRSRPSRGHLSCRRPSRRPVADAPPSASGLDTQEPEAPETTPINIPNDTTTGTTLNNEPTRGVAWFITIEKIGQTRFCDVQMESAPVELSARRLLDSQSEESLVWDSTTRSVSFAVVDEVVNGYPVDAIERVHNRFIGEMGGILILGEDS
ncbi:uncharacterized protein NECHADRAFT_85167 [Fusarium vanettenii 77-13-4]|uniref:Uncharacterized protein n=1 Tax=Fusarium vanettenii (strain ATCC MYA-4622 / CBS 123669 / FGSC 9596 / NRRL 45880 / 77-13-4) TaxID=660122 RepID=C7YV65_FUSV7|nr:uncharacterized protein NECHADRAFT_85167 [Fusarium vanettenii 77-13-4]EEU44526.1 predicted protein [Fusarium vanettenii 77-13-4]